MKRDKVRTEKEIFALNIFCKSAFQVAFKMIGWRTEKKIV